MNPDAFTVLGAITDFGRRVRVAGAVADVKNNLDAAFREPETMAQGLANAHDMAVRFARSMRRILAVMREIEDRILGNPNAASILRTFFQDFVDGLLIADYKQLKTSNNPLSPPTYDHVPGRRHARRCRAHRQDFPRLHRTRRSCLLSFREKQQ